MTCPRCAGLVVVDEGIDIHTGFRCEGVRCLNCGHWSDVGWQANRLVPAGTVPATDGRRLPRQVQAGICTEHF